MRRAVGIGAIVLGLSSCLYLDPGPTKDEEDEGIADSASGELHLLTYNVAGLPQGISSSDPERNIPMISPLLNNYPIVFVQEDFAYHDELIKDAHHPYQSRQPSRFSYLNSGLNRLSVTPFHDYDRIMWRDCSGIFADGSDCLTPKGFSFARHELIPGVFVHIYNVHMDSGRSAGDSAARDAELDQLLGYINERSMGEAVILIGDFNIHPVSDERDQTLYDRLVQEGFVDVCAATSCYWQDSVDRVFVRDSGRLFFSPWNMSTDLRFVDPSGNPLSDHSAYTVWLGYAFLGSGDDM